MVAGGNPGSGDPDEASALLSQIVWTIPRIYHRLTAIGDRVYGRYGLSAGKRSLLRDLAIQGPHTIAAMVRIRRPITRQYIQRLVSDLRQAGLVALSENAEDRRSKIVHLTEHGRQVIEALAPAEQSLMKALAADSAIGELLAARNVLAGVIKRLEDGRFRPPGIDAD